MAFWFIMVAMVISIFLTQGVYAIFIMEVELNPPGTDSGNEWVELYFSEESDVDGFYLENGDGGTYNLSGTLEGYVVIEFDSQWLDNSEEIVYLKNGDIVIEKTIELKDNDDDGNSWNYCDGEWIFIESSEGEENLCDDGDNYEYDRNDNGNDDGDENSNSLDDDSDANLNGNDDNNLVNVSGGREIEKLSEVRAGEGKKIVLNSPVEKVEENRGESKSFISDKEKLRRWVIYSFLLFTIILIILLALRRL
jgi:hypothetical protein